MNFEEIINARESSMHREKMPIGEFYRKQIDGKYHYVVDLKPALIDSIVFCEAMKADVEWSAKRMDKQQLHGELHGDSNGIYEIELETGNFQTLANLLSTNPAIVAQKGFIDSVFNSLAEYLDSLHAEGIYQLCLAPESVFVRKGSNVPMLLTHGSFYQNVNDLNQLYGDYESFVAPEVMAHEEVDERSDVYALGRLIEFLFEQAEIPYEYKMMLKKATAQNPAERFQTLAEMKSALEGKRNARRMIFTFIACVAIALLAVWVYIDIMPEASTVEFVEPAPKTNTDDPFASYFDPEMEMLLDGDSIPMTDQERMYQKKAEEIFRKRYAQEADRILSDIYNNDRMNGTEKNYRAGSQTMVEELIKMQTQMGEEAGLSEEEAGRIGQEIVDQLTKQKQEQVTRKGYIKPKESDEEE